jgi:nucleotide-binding universal stress UspA family protein
MKILLPIDGSSYSDAAVEVVAARPWPAESEVKLIAIVELRLVAVPAIWVVPDSHYLKLLHELQEQARVALERAEARLLASNAERVAPLRISSEILNGNAKVLILSEAQSWDADLIVLGSHGRGALGRFLLGSVSQAVALQAACSVEIVRRAASETGVAATP